MCGQAAAGLHAAALQRALLRGRTGRVGSKKAKPFKPNPSRLYYPCARVSLCSSWFGRFWVEPLIHAERSIWVLNEAPATVTVTQRGCTQLNSTQLNSTQLNSTQLNSTQLNSTQLNSTQLNSTQLPHCLGRSKHVTRKFIVALAPQNVELEKQSAGILFALSPLQSCRNCFL